MISRRAKATDITYKVKQAVWERDEHKCVVCGSYHNVMPNAHYISRAHGGLGIEKNVVTLCMVCHFNYDQTDQRKRYKEIIKEYLKSRYTDWNEEDLIYKK